jgi:hypothetical protein
VGRVDRPRTTGELTSCATRGVWVVVVLMVVTVFSTTDATDGGVGAFFLINHLFTIHAQRTMICRLTTTSTTTHHHHHRPTTSGMCSLYRYRSGPCHFVSGEDYYSSEFASSVSPTVAAPVVSRDVLPYLTQYVTTPTLSSTLL